MWDITVDVALRQVSDGIARLPAEMVALDEADGRVLAEDIPSPIDLPPFANSAMDGYAVIAADLLGADADHPVRLPIVARVAAGQVARNALQPGQAMRIMTGAPIPPGADAVVKFEDTSAPAADHIDILVAPASGAYIRVPGEDVQQGQIALPAGTILTPAAIGLLAALGYPTVPCARRPRVAVIGTGDELVAPGQPLPPGAIYDSNSPLIAALIRRLGGSVTRYGAVADTAAAIQHRLLAAVADRPDLIITSGGVSLGDFDLVKEVLRDAGEIAFWQVRMRPGKPLAFGRIQGIPLLGLPGNPIAAFVGCLLYGRAILRAMQGLNPLPDAIDAICDEPIRNGSGRRNFLRGTASFRNGQCHVRQAGGQLPTQLAPLAQGNCLIVAHEDRALYAMGDLIPIILFG